MWTRRHGSCCSSLGTARCGKLTSCRRRCGWCGSATRRRSASCSRASTTASACSSRFWKTRASLGRRPEHPLPSATTCSKPFEHAAAYPTVGGGCDPETSGWCLAWLVLPPTRGGTCLVGLRRVPRISPANDRFRRPSGTSMCYRNNSGSCFKWPATRLIANSRSLVKLRKPY